MQLPDTIEGCHTLITELLAIIAELRTELAELRTELAELRAQNAELRAQNAELRTQNAALQTRITDLEHQLNQNSRNSHRPPSSDGLTKPGIPKPPSGKKRGGQFGHRGNTLKMVEPPDERVELRPEVCEHCQEKFTGRQEYQLKSRRQVFDLPPMTLQVKEYASYGCRCSRCGKENQGAYPRGVTAPVQYGSGVRSLVVVLHQQGCMSVEKIRRVFGDIFSAPLNASTIMEYQAMAHELLEADESHIIEQLSASPLLHADESGVRVEGNLQWLHTIGNKEYTHQWIHRKRGYAAHEEDGVLQRYSGWLVHDCWGPYFRFEKVRHAICNAHILRELEAITEGGKRWSGAMHKLLMELYHRTEKGNGRIAEEKVAGVRRRFMRIVRKGKIEEGPPERRGSRGRLKRSKGLNLVERLEKHQAGVLAFAEHEEVPFTNNLAERDIRPVKIKVKVAGCFRTILGAAHYARINSFFSTVRKQKFNPFTELLKVFNGSIPDYRLGST